MDICQPSITEAEEILKIQKEAFRAQGEIYRNFAIKPLTQTLESVREEFQTKSFLAAYIDGRMVASVRYWSSDETVNIERLAVKPEFQNRGIGSALLRAIERHCPVAAVFQLFTGTKSLRNIHVYEKLGYVVVDEKDDDQGIRTLYMRKSRQRAVQGKGETR